MRFYKRKHDPETVALGSFKQPTKRDNIHNICEQLLKELALVEKKVYTLEWKNGNKRTKKQDRSNACAFRYGKAYCLEIRQAIDQLRDTLDLYAFKETLGIVHAKVFDRESQINEYRMNFLPNFITHMVNAIKDYLIARKTKSVTVEYLSLPYAKTETAQKFGIFVERARGLYASISEDATQKPVVLSTKTTLS